MPSRTKTVKRSDFVQHFYHLLPDTCSALLFFHSPPAHYVEGVAAHSAHTFPISFPNRDELLKVLLLNTSRQEFSLRNAEYVFDYKLSFWILHSVKNPVTATMRIESYRFLRELAKGVQNGVETLDEYISNAALF